MIKYKTNYLQYEEDVWQNGIKEEPDPDVTLESLGIDKVGTELGSDRMSDNCAIRSRSGQLYIFIYIFPLHFYIKYLYILSMKYQTSIAILTFAA